MSRVPVWCEIVCRECAQSATGAFTSGRIPRRNLIQSAKAGGWAFKHDEAFCSQKCLDRFENRAAKETTAP